jgi:2-polyprenyl-3-methyl-5-hydroxy-6-metoxy-1,4-benzoquinol methylase
MKNENRIEKEIEHGKYIYQKGEELWNWSSPAGKVRWARRCQLFLSFIGDQNKDILEIGCGTGLFTSELIKSKNNITAIDISPELISLAKKRLTAPNVTLLIENAYKTSFDNEKFDFIVGSSVLHHLDVNDAIKEIYRLLKPGGKFIFSEPNMMNPQIAIQKNIPFIKKMAGDSPDETAFTKFGITRKIRKAGFHEISVYPFDFLHPAIPKSLLKIMIPFCLFLEKVPIVNQFAGSLIIKCVK